MSMCVCVSVCVCVCVCAHLVGIENDTICTAYLSVCSDDLRS